MNISSVRELLCVVDFLLMTVKEYNKLSICMKMTVDVFTDDELTSVVNINNVESRVIVSYDDNGFNIISKIMTNENYTKNYRRMNYKQLNDYLTTVANGKNIEITEVTLNDVDLELRTKEDIVKYCITNNNCDNVKITFIDKNSKLLTFQYCDGVLIRLIKMSNKYTLYINKLEKLNSILESKELYNITFGNKLPDITTIMDLYKRKAELEKLTFEYKIC